MITYKLTPEDLAMCKRVAAKPDDKREEILAHWRGMWRTSQTMAPGMVTYYRRCAEKAGKPYVASDWFTETQLYEMAEWQAKLNKVKSLLAPGRVTSTSVSPHSDSHRESGGPIVRRGPEPHLPYKEV